MSSYISLHCTALHCTEPHFTIPRCTVLRCTSLHFTPLYLTALYQVASLMGIKNLSSRSLKVSASESRAAAECSSIAEDFLLVSGWDTMFYFYVDMLCPVMSCRTVLWLVTYCLVMSWNAKLFYVRLYAKNIATLYYYLKTCPVPAVTDIASTTSTSTLVIITATSLQQEMKAKLFYLIFPPSL